VNVKHRLVLLIIGATCQTTHGRAFCFSTCQWILYTRKGVPILLALWCPIRALASGRCPHRERTSAYRVGLSRERTSSGPMPPRMSSAPPAASQRISCGTPDLLLKHPDTTVATYKRRQIKHLKQAYETLAKTAKKHLTTIANICNIQMKHLQTYV
jgi:hypothetical protein